MTVNVAIAAQDALLLEELRTRVDGMDGVTLVGAVDSLRSLLALVEAEEVDVAFVEDRLEDRQTLSVRDVLMRDPALPVYFVTSDIGSEAFKLALEAGARGLLTYPFSLEEIQARVAAAQEWRRRLAPRLVGAEQPEEQRGRVITFVGAKGGVGVTNLMTHLAWRLQEVGTRARVCVVDLDLESADVPSFVDVQHRVSLAELARLGDDITVRAVADTIVAHDHGTHLLLAPRTIREVDVLDPAVLRNILRRVREAYDIVLVDAGASVTPVQAAAVEVADDVVQVVTNDVPCLRAARRQLAAWQALQVREPAAVKVLVNKYDRRGEVQQVTADKLIQGQRLETMIPDLDRALERAINARTPQMVRDKTWWGSLDSISAELGLVRAQRGERPRRQRRGRDKGQGTLEMAAVLPFALLMVVLALQVVLAGLGSIWVNHAASEGARAVSLGLSSVEVVDRARDAVPAAFRSSIDVAPYSPGARSVTVRTRVMFASLSSTQSVDMVRSPKVVVEP